ncbi:MAG: hypothetical protein EOQ42_07060 [Mesorhizobium sp.]|nr:MAG: hypothetical protein EOQ42_07060 [Mesorhizobium sp.]RWF68908.1 MAG: hypothetical protein EOS26_26525 [Mesorhizobium sp.]
MRILLVALQTPLTFRSSRASEGDINLPAISSGVVVRRACEQARRKAQWLSEDHSRIPTMLRRTALDVPRFVPPVVVNQSNGTSCRFGETVVIDEHFLTVYLSGGSYVSAASLDFKNPDRTGFATRVLYQTAEEGENAIPKVFESHPGLANLLTTPHADAAKHF